jgi:hypothetical protein
MAASLVRIHAVPRWSKHGRPLHIDRKAPSLDLVVAPLQVAEAGDGPGKGKSIVFHVAGNGFLSPIVGPERAGAIEIREVFKIIFVPGLSISAEN